MDDDADKKDYIGMLFILRAVYVYHNTGPLDMHAAQAPCRRTISCRDVGFCYAYDFFRSPLWTIYDI